MSLADALNSRRLNVWNSMQELVDRTDAEGRSFSGEEEASWAKMNAEISAIDERIKAVRDAEARTQAADKAVNRGSKLVTPGSDEFRQFLTVGSPQRTYTARANGPVNFRDLSKLSAGAGANTVPTSFYAQLVQHLVESGALLGAGVTVLNTAGGENLEIPKTTAHSSAVIEGETDPIAESDPAFGKVTLGAYKYATSFQVSSELLQDTGVDMTGYLAEQAGAALGRAFGADIVSGNGSDKPLGIVPASTLGVTGAAAISGGLGTHGTADQGGDVLINLFHSVIAPYRNRPSCGWLMRDATAATIRKIKDGNDQYLWQPGLTVGQPDTILGRPVTVDPNVAAMAAAALSIAFGDFSKYYVRIAGGVRFERSDDYAFANDLVTFRAIMRADGDLVDTTGAVKHFKGGAAE